MSYIHYAKAAHDAVGQVRKYTREPYWTHCERVAKIVASWGGNDTQIAAAWLHDVVEDTHINLGKINQMFGNEVAALVMYLTDFKEGSTRDERKAAYYNRLAKAPAAAQAIKAADIIDNVSDIVTFDIVFARTYVPEKRALVEALSLPVHIYNQVDATLRKAEAQL